MQGLKAADGSLLLTDPAIHCVDMAMFGDTNLGLEGMSMFYKSHTCGDICRIMGLRHNAEG